MAKNKEKCPFCGSEEIRLQTPYVTRVTHTPEYTFCCKSQAKNHEYTNKRIDPRTGQAPERVGQW